MGGEGGSRAWASFLGTSQWASRAVWTRGGVGTAVPAGFCRSELSVPGQAPGKPWQLSASTLTRSLGLPRSLGEGGQWW